MNRGTDLAFISFFVQLHLSVIHTLQSWGLCANVLWCFQVHRALIQGQLAIESIPKMQCIFNGERGKILTFP